MKTYINLLSENDLILYNAVLYDGSKDAVKDVMENLSPDSIESIFYNNFDSDPEKHRFYINTFKGRTLVKKGDYIVRRLGSMKLQHYTPEIFKKIYKEV